MNIIDFLSVAPFIIDIRVPWTGLEPVTSTNTVTVVMTRKLLYMTVHGTLFDFTIKPLMTWLFGDSIQLLRLLRVFRMLRDGLSLCTC